MGFAFSQPPFAYWKKSRQAPAETSKLRASRPRSLPCAAASVEIRLAAASVSRRKRTKKIPPEKSGTLGRRRCVRQCQRSLCLACGGQRGRIEACNRIAADVL